jgi:hypothetical protein
MATTTPPMTEQQLIDAISATMSKAHLACQPMLLRLAELYFPDRTPPTVTQTWVVSSPLGGDAMIRNVGFDIKPAA